MGSGSGMGNVFWIVVIGVILMATLSILASRGGWRRSGRGTSGGHGSFGDSGGQPDLADGQAGGGGHHGHGHGQHHGGHHGHDAGGFSGGHGMSHGGHDMGGGHHG